MSNKISIITGTFADAWSSYVREHGTDGTLDEPIDQQREKFWNRIWEDYKIRDNPDASFEVMYDDEESLSAFVLKFGPTATTY